jgi:hypothetical protein
MSNATVVDVTAVSVVNAWLVIDGDLSLVPPQAASAPAAQIIVTYSVRFITFSRVVGAPLDRRASGETKALCPMDEFFAPDTRRTSIGGSRRSAHHCPHLQLVRHMHRPAGVPPSSGAEQTGAMNEPER